VLVYLRPQDAFTESLYGEVVRGNTISFVTFGRHIASTIAAGGFAPNPGAIEIPLDYEGLLAPFAERFGHGSIIARGYPGRAKPHAIYHDFFSVIGALYPPFAVSPVDLAIGQASANESLAFGGLLQRAHARVHGEACAHDYLSDVFAAAPWLDEGTFTSRFSLLVREDARALLDRFGPSNERLEMRYGARIPFVEATDIAPIHDPRWAETARERAAFDVVVERWLSEQQPDSNNH
jgi:hypothetical protein